MGQLLDFHVKGKTALITGAARGIGRSCALALAEAGADIALGLRDVQQDSGVTDEIQMLGREVLPLQMDVSDTHQIQEAVKKSIEYFGKIDILVHSLANSPEITKSLFLQNWMRTFEMS